MNVGVLPLGISFYLLVSHPISHIKEKKEIEWKGNQKIKEFPEGWLDYMKEIYFPPLEGNRCKWENRFHIIQASQNKSLIEKTSPSSQT